MVENLRQLRSSTANKCIPQNPPLEHKSPKCEPRDEHQDMIKLRQRWELASVLNFINVFRPVVPKDMKIRAEEIETALIACDEKLERIHIALLKGIPPINRNLMAPDAWITCVCRKLATCWSLVAEGKIPLKADHGKEIPLYKQLDPTTRLVILKALCDIRAEQDDILEFIEDQLKRGTTIDYFRKERMEVGDSGVTYWYEGSRVIGYRLYKEIGKTYSKQTGMGKNCEEPTFESHWETIAINFEEFPKIMDNLSSSKIPGEAVVGEAIKAEILPILLRREQVKLKKASEQRREQKMALRLLGFPNCRVGPTRSCRDHRPARYTFDEYDGSVEEAIKVAMGPDYVEPRKRRKKYDNGLGQEYPSSYGRNMDTLNKLSSNDDGDLKTFETNNDVKNLDNDDGDHKTFEINNDVKNLDNITDYGDNNGNCDGYKDVAGVDDDDDDIVNFDSKEKSMNAPSKSTYEEKHLHVNDATVDSDSEKKCMNAPSKPVYEEKHLHIKLVSGLRRSSRNFEACHVMTKKRLRQRPAENAGYKEVIALDSGDENPTKKYQTKSSGLEFK